MNTWVRRCVYIAVATLTAGCGPRTYTPSTAAEKSAYASISDAYGVMDSGYAQNKIDIVWSYRLPGYTCTTKEGQVRDPEQAKSLTQFKMFGANTIGTTSTIRDMRVKGDKAVVEVLERCEKTTKVPDNMPRMLGLPAPGSRVHSVEVTRARDHWVETRQGWFLSRRVVIDGNGMQ